jgi:DNA-directed RNA polymerase subunit M/transcription elongation factor TFIIS
MAKKKSVAPSKTCVDPDCGATMHPRQLVCPKCGKEQPRKKEVGKKLKPKAPSAAPKAAAAAPTPGGLPQAVNFVRQVGGLKQAQKLLGQIEEIKKL